METLHEIWMGILWFFTSPQTSGLAMAISAMTTFVAAWKLVTEFVSDLWPIAAERRGVALIRATLALSLIAALTLASAGIVISMRA